MRVRILLAVQLTLGAPILLSAAAPAARPSGPDLILQGGRVYTGDSKQPYVEALVDPLRALGVRLQLRR